MGALHSFSIKNIFHDKMDLRLFYFCVTIRKSLQMFRKSQLSLHPVPFNIHSFKTIYLYQVFEISLSI